MITLDQVLDSAAKLPGEQQDMLIEILKKRRIESRRAEIAEDAKRSIADYKAGRLQAQPAEEVIEELRKYLEEDE